MDILFGFLIGVAFPPAFVIVVAALIAARAPAGVIGGIVAVMSMAGPAVWIMTFIAFGVAAGFMAFAGWILGLGIAAMMVFLLLASRFRRFRSQPPWATSS